MHECMEGMCMDARKACAWMHGRHVHECMEGMCMDAWKACAWMHGRHGRHVHGCVRICLHCSFIARKTISFPSQSIRHSFHSPAPTIRSCFPAHSSSHPSHSVTHPLTHLPTQSFNYAPTHSSTQPSHSATHPITQLPTQTPSLLSLFSFSFSKRTKMFEIIECIKQYRLIFQSFFNQSINQSIN